jgi:hypothetical protein
MRSITTDRHANARDRKRDNSRKMLVTGRSVFVIQSVIVAKADEARRTLEALRAADAKRGKR